MEETSNVVWNSETKTREFRTIAKLGLSKIQFSNPEFKEGLNLTTRRGTKWASASGELDVVETGKEDVILGTATIKEIKVVPFPWITNDMLENEHDPNCRDYEGLFKEMQRVYPTFTQFEVVTLIYFEFKKL